MPPLTDQAICIRQWDWSETSQTVSLLSREHGVLRAVAKGAKRENARFSGGLEVATRGEMIVRVKSGDVLSLLLAWDLQEVFPGTRASLQSFHATMLLMDLAHRAVQEHDPHPRLFDALVQALRTLGVGADSLALARFLWGTLVETGHKPELDRDARTGAPLEPRPVYSFLPRLGGVADPSRDRADPPDPREGALVWKVRGETIEFLRSLERGEETPFSDQTHHRAVHLLASYFREAVHTDLPTLPGYLRASGRHTPE